MGEGGAHQPAPVERRAGKVILVNQTDRVLLFSAVAPLPDGSRRAIWILPLILLALVTALGVGLWLSALNVQYRDVRYTAPFLAQLWLFATPIAYPSSLLTEPWRTIYGINPMVGVVEGFRWALLGTRTEPGAMVLVSSLAALVVLIGGALYFRRMEQTFADVV